MASNIKLLILCIICKSYTVIQQVMQNDSTEHCEPWQTDLYTCPKVVSSSEMWYLEKRVFQTFYDI